MRYLLFGVIAVIFIGCRSVSELKRMADCEYEFVTVDQIKMAGVDVDGKSKLKDLKFSDLAKITQTYLTGTLPVTLTANVSVRNPNEKPAALEKLDWKLFIEDIEITSGTINERFEIGAGETQILKIPASIDAMEFLKDETKKEVLNFAFNVADPSGKPTHMKIKIKPAIRVGNTLLAAPNYFTVKQKLTE